MAKFFKHVGEHNGKKVVLVEKSIPGEPHMAAVIYSSIIPSKYHDDIMGLLESAEGQNEKEFGLIMNRRMASDGTNLLQACAMEGYIKKVPTNQVIVKPNASSSIRLDELNTLLHAAGQGKEAIDRLEQMERESGMKDTRKNPDAKTTKKVDMVEPKSISEPAIDLLDDRNLAANYASQSVKMRTEAQALVAEADRLEREAKKLDPKVKIAKVSKNVKSASTTA